MPDKKSYKQFIYGLKKYALEQYISKIEENKTIDNPGVRNQVSLAIENMERLLLKADYFDHTQRLKEVKYFLKIQKQYGRVSKLATLPLRNDEVQEKMKSLGEKSQALESQKIYLPFSPYASLDEEMSVVEPIHWHIEKAIAFDFESAFKNNQIIPKLKAFSDAMEKLVASDPVAAVESIEKFFIEWPLSQPLGLEREQKNEFLAVFRKLNALYFENIGEGNKKKPQFVDAQLSFVTILASAIGGNSSYDTRLFDLMCTEFYYNSAAIYSNSYFGSENNQYDRRLEELALLWKKAKEKSIDVVVKRNEYFESMVKEQGLSDILIQYFSFQYPAQVETLKSDTDKALFVISIYCGASESEKEKIINDLCSKNAYNDDSKKGLKEKLAIVESEFKMLRSFYEDINLAFAKASQLEYPDVDAKSTFPLKMEYNHIKTNAVFKIVSLSSPEVIGWPEKQGEKSVIDCILSTAKEDPNSIQVEGPYGAKILYQKKDVKWGRDFLHLRSVPDLQLSATIDYFRYHLDQLAEKEKQIYLEKSLFQPGLLLQALEKEPHVIEKLQTFLRFGLQASSVGDRPEALGLFFMKLENKVNQYARDYFADKKNKGKVANLEGELIGRIKEIDTLLTRNLSREDQTELHAQKIFILSNRLSKSALEPK